MDKLITAVDNKPNTMLLYRYQYCQSSLSKVLQDANTKPEDIVKWNCQLLYKLIDVGSRYVGSIPHTNMQHIKINSKGDVIPNTVIENIAFVQPHIYRGNN